MTTPAHTMTRESESSLVSGRVYALTHAKETVTAAFATSPDSAPGRLVKKLYRSHEYRRPSKGEWKKRSQHVLSVLDVRKTATRKYQSDKNGHAKPERHRHIHRANTHRSPGAQTASDPLVGKPTEHDLNRAAECGDFGRRPSDLFLQHHCDCIVSAQHEVFLATNFWQASKSSQMISDALKELSRRAEKRKRRVVVKAMYDRAHLKMFTHNRVYVTEEEWLKEVVMLPKRSEMPWIDFELVNYHRPLLGTFHAKFMIVDRKLALVSSNNVQDRPNMEMMVHLEGPIVDSLYDMALLCWSKPMHPPLPLLDHPYRPPGGGYKFAMDNEYSTVHNLDGTKGAELYYNLALNERQPLVLDAPPANGGVFISGRYQTITEHLNAGDQPNTHATIAYVAPASPSDEYMPHIFHAMHTECPMVLVNRGPKGYPGNPPKGLRNTQDIAWLAGLKYARRTVFIQSPTFNARPAVEGVLNAVRRGVECTLYLDVGFNDGGEALPGQGGTNEQVAKKMYTALGEEERQRLRMFWYTGKDQIKPINASARKRNCHVKLMIIDNSVGIVGNGNQDTQSWFHSQEVNVMIDNPKVCEEWLDAIRRNQNTHLHELQKDGIYRDADGNVLVDSTRIDNSILGMIRGARTAIARVRGRSGP
ncbi:hypothetical protein ID866_5028 [Astraeus odoratus]|nr:hypothetical protein ID866_5028 [Astraeus odoratus]